MITASFLVSLGVTGKAALPVLADIDILQYRRWNIWDSIPSGGAREKFSDEDFKDCGVERSLYQQIAEHEAAHVQFLQGLLSSKATQACSYHFPYANVQGFKALAQVIEMVGYPPFHDQYHAKLRQPFLTAAAGFLSVELRHYAWVETSDRDARSAAIDVPLGPHRSTRSQHCTSLACPASNPRLPVKQFPALTLASPKNGSLKPNSSLVLTVPHNLKYDASQCLYVAFFSKLGATFVPYSLNGTVTVPKEAGGTGTIYAVLTSSNSTATDDITIAVGLVVLNFESYYPTVLHAADEDCSCSGTDTGFGAGSGGGSG